MKTILKLISFISLLLLPSAIHAQAGQGYIVVNGSFYMQGQISYHGDECKLLYYPEANTIHPTVYSCDSVTEFGFDNGDVYRTREFSGGISPIPGTTKKLFLKVLEEGQLTLYSSPLRGHRFVIETDTLILLDKYFFTEQLQLILSPGYNLQKVRYRSRSLKNMVRHYNGDR